jgi:hypothetical protein
MGDGGALNCESVAGGQSCAIRFDAEAVIFRWVNEGALTTSISGACSDAEAASWSLAEGLTFVGAQMSCSVIAYVRTGECASFQIFVDADFIGANAPPHWHVDGGSVGICA